MAQNDLDDLEKKSRELEEREQVLNKRESLLEREKALEKRQKVFTEAETKLDILNKQIKAKEAIIAACDVEIDQKKSESESVIDSLIAKRDASRRACIAQEGVLADLKKQESNVGSSIRLKKSELADVQAQVKETKDYLKEQEKLTEDTIASWNSTLVEFRKEAEIVQSEKDKLSGDIIRLEQEKTAMVIETKKLEDKLENLSTSYEQKVEVYKSDLRRLDTIVKDKENKISSLEASFAMKELEFSTREKSLILKEANVNKREHELDQQERRLKMNLGMV